MSLVAVMLATADQVEIDDLHIKVKDITDMILKLKREVIETKENSYIKFLPFSDENNELLMRATNLHNELTCLHTRIESQIKRELSDSTGELHDLKATLQQTDLSFNFAMKLYKVHLCFISASEKQKALNFFEAALMLKETETLLSNAEDEITSLDIHEALNIQLSRMRNDFLISVLENWKLCIKFIEVVAHHYKKNKEITVSIMKDDLKSDVIRALHYYSHLIIEINKFGDKFLHNVLMPVIDQKSLVKITENEKYSTLHIETKNVVNTDCVDVIKNLVIIFDFLFIQFDIMIGDDKHFVSELGERISNEFVEYFIKNCLAKAVPKCLEKLDSYNHVINSLLVLGNLLYKKEFLVADDSRLLEYSQNVDVLITNKICDSYIESARVLMKHDLDDMIETGTFKGNAELNDTLHASDVSAVRKIKQFRPPDSDHYVYVSELSVNTNQFPVCQISKSAAELFELVKTLLDESAKSKSKQCAVKLFSVARNIFRLYCDIVPLHHKKMLDSFPRQAALFSNNCYYLSHNLLTLGSTFKSELLAVFQGDMITFIDLIDPLLRIGNKVLSNQINIQKKQMIDILRDSGLVTVTESRDFPAGIEKAIRQCIRQLLLLQKLWYQVLPDNTYCESMGSLLCTFVQELIDRVCSFVDIPAHTASELVRVFTIVREKTPAIFPDPNEVFMYVRNWSRFIELLKLLGANLQDVEERWSDGKGPLAQDFTANQVKLLVKALFQISDKRADLLARIK